MRTAKFNNHAQESKDSTSTQKNQTGKSWPKIQATSFQLFLIREFNFPFQWSDSRYSFLSHIWKESPTPKNGNSRDTTLFAISLGETRSKPAPARTSWHSRILHFCSHSPAGVHELLLLRKSRSSMLCTEFTLLLVLWCQVEHPLSAPVRLGIPVSGKPDMPGSFVKLPAHS